MRHLYRFDIGGDFTVSLTQGQISVANSKVYAKLGNGTVRDLTLDTNTVYRHPSTKQCSWTPSSTGAKATQIYSGTLSLTSSSGSTTSSDRVLYKVLPSSIASRITAPGFLILRYVSSTATVKALNNTTYAARYMVAASNTVGASNSTSRILFMSTNKSGSYTSGQSVSITHSGNVDAWLFSRAYENAYIAHCLEDNIYTTISSTDTTYVWAQTGNTSFTITAATVTLKAYWLPIL